MTGIFNSLANALSPAEISEISSCRLSCARRVVDLQQLQIIDDDESHILLRLQPARFCPQFQNAEAGAVIDEHLGLRQF